MSDEPWLTPPQLATWMQFGAVLHALPQALDAQLRTNVGMNLFEYMILAGLSDFPDNTTTVTNLSLFAGGSLSRLSHAVGRLERQGWVTRRSEVSSRRHTLVTLTEAGIEHLASAAPGHVAEVRRLVIDPLSDDQLAALRTLSRDLLGTVSPGFITFLDELPTRSDLDEEPPSTGATG